MKNEKKEERTETEEKKRRDTACFQGLISKKHTECMITG